MENKEKLYRPIDYARLKGVTPAAVSRMIRENRVTVVLFNNQRYIKV